MTLMWSSKRVDEEGQENFYSLLFLTAYILSFLSIGEKVCSKFIN